MPPAPIKASTQEHLNIEDIQNDLVILKDGSCCLVIQVTAINFGLLSEAEQDAIIYAYAGLLNSLTFPIQIIIRSKRKDISSYLNLISEQGEKLKKPALLEQLKKYRAFVEETVKKNEVLDKKFYISLPFSTLELGMAKTLSQTFKPKKGLPYAKSYILEKAKTNLYPKKDHLIRQLHRLGLKSKQLNTQKLLELFYNVYNPESFGQTFVSPKDYKTSLVKPAIAGPKPRLTWSKPEERKTSMDVSVKKPLAPGQTQAAAKPNPLRTNDAGPQTGSPPAPKVSPEPSEAGVASPTTSVSTPQVIKPDDGGLVSQTPPAQPTKPSEGLPTAPVAGTMPNSTPSAQAEIDQAAKEVDIAAPAAASPAAVSPAPPQPPAPTGEQTKTE